MNSQSIKVSRLVPNTGQIEGLPKNPRLIRDEKFAKLVKSIKDDPEMMELRELLVMPHGKQFVVIAGNMRLRAMMELGYKEAPCKVLDKDTSVEKLKAYTIKDNVGFGEHDWDQLTNEWNSDQLQDWGLDLPTSFGEETEIPEETKEDVIHEAPSNPVTVKGDVWTLGNHRILCGDCRDFNDVEKLLKGAKINVAVTSPPYASQRKYDETSGFKPIPPDEYVEWYRDVAANIMANIASDGSYFCNITEAASDGFKLDYVKRLLLNHIDDWGWNWIEEYCWPRPALPLNPNTSRRFKNGWESVYHYATQKGYKFNPDTVRHESDGCFKYSDQKAAGKMIGGTAQGVGGGIMSPVNTGEGLAYPSNVLPNFGGADVVGHSAAYPVGLPEFFIKAFSDNGDTIYDPFMGSGTTLIAAEKNGRIGYGTEISPGYCDVIVKRWQDFTGQQAIHEATGRTFNEMLAAKETAE